MFQTPVDTRFAFQPLVNIHTGGVVALEMRARPPHGDVRALLWSAARAGRLEKLDVALAVAAAHHSSTHETLLPLHLNLLADTIVDNGEALAPLHRALDSTGRPVSETVLDINPPFAELKPELFLVGLRRLRRRGYRIALDGVGAGGYPLTVIAEARPDLIKMDREIVAGLPGNSGCLAVLEALVHLAPRIGAQLVAEGVEDPEQLATLRQHGVGIAQGNLLSPPSRRPMTCLPGTGVAKCRAPMSATPTRGQPGARITDFLHPALTLPMSAKAEEVRTVFSAQSAATSVVLLDDDGKPGYTLDRNRFLLAVSGAYGHALHARREAAELGDPPRVLRSRCGALAALELVRNSETHRMYDDIVLIDPDGRCVGVVHISDVVLGVAEMNTEQAAALHPLTRLPGSDVLADLVDRKVAEGDIFAVSWLDVDDFGSVNDIGGFTAGDDLIRDLGRAVAKAAQAVTSASIAHLGGDDFVVVTSLDDVMSFGSAVLDEPWEAEGQALALSLASLVCVPGTVAGHRDVSRMLATLRHRAKSIPGTSWVCGRANSDRVHVVRGQASVIHKVQDYNPRHVDRLRRDVDRAPAGQRTG